MSTTTKIQVKPGHFHRLYKSTLLEKVQKTEDEFDGHVQMIVRSALDHIEEQVMRLEPVVSILLVGVTDSKPYNFLVNYEAYKTLKDIFGNCQMKEDSIRVSIFQILDS